MRAERRRGENSTGPAGYSTNPGLVWFGLLYRQPAAVAAQRR